MMYMVFQAFSLREKACRLLYKQHQTPRIMVITRSYGLRIPLSAQKREGQSEHCAEQGDHAGDRTGDQPA